MSSPSTPAQVERALNDVYAEVIALEARRTRARRKLERAMAEALHPGGAARLGEQAVTVRQLDREIESLRAVLADLRALPVDPTGPRDATPRRPVR